jgi:hypothetical protein
MANGVRAREELVVGDRVLIAASGAKLNLLDQRALPCCCESQLA